METNDRFFIDSHKLMFHVDRVSKWLSGEAIYPIYIDVGISQGCNHRCVFCAFDYNKYRPVFLPPAYFYPFIRSAARHGVKSVMFAGEGEPLLHPHAADFIAASRTAGIDTAVTSNGVLFTPALSHACLPHLSWFRASIDAGTAVTYSKIHRAPPEDFRTVIENLAAAVEMRRKSRLKCVIGGQFLLIRQNYDEAPRLAATLRRIGLDYLIIKPYSQHPYSGNRPAADFSRKELEDMERRLSAYSCTGFQVVFRKTAIRKKNEPKPYARCEGLPFITVVTSEGDLYPCSNFVGIKKYSLGNVCREPFHVVWNSRRKKRIFKDLLNRWDVRACRCGCRLDEINRYLHALQHPGAHVNFI